ncbi:MAG: tRNA (adenosine(37)-N6)-threonylcarbamoyltransferase complex dimerization subunit type 1 TsaB [Dehalococcoidia bacterium]|nr:tRNA (adenosine(37)-N6)-threonylcarbamoyltransferase complex dimerization subunit type 1 TsaB [Dehalococcoidia bacterium]
MNITLAIDTASSDIALAFAVGGEVAGSLALDGSQDHSKLLLRAIDELLGPLRKELTAILVTRGPGSYAGLRVGIATAQGIGLAMGIPVRGIGTMQAAAAAAGMERLTIVHPAGRGEFAAQEFAGDRPLGPLRSARAEDLRELTIAGEGAGALGGREVSPEERCRLGLAWMLPRLAEHPDVEAIYLREPHISTPRRPAAAS